MHEVCRFESKYPGGKGSDRICTNDNIGRRDQKERCSEAPRVPSKFLSARCRRLRGGYSPRSNLRQLEQIRLSFAGDMYKSRRAHFLSKLFSIGVAGFQCLLGQGFCQLELPFQGLPLESLGPLWRCSSEDEAGHLGTSKRGISQSGFY
jgi:hypothetical protein